MMITPSAALGTGSMRGIAKRRNNPTTPAATTTAPCDLAPAESLTADREFDEETGKALVSPPTRFAAPSAVSSWFASTW